VSCSLRRVIINRIREFLIVFIIYIGQGKFQDTKGETEVANQRTNNTMVKRKRTKGQTMIYNTQHRKLKSNANTVKSGDDNMCSGKVRSSFSTNGNSTNITNLNNHLSPQLTQNIVLKRLQEQKYIGVNGLPDPLSHTPKWVSMCVCVFRVSIFPLFQ